MAVSPALCSPSSFPSHGPLSRSSSSPVDVASTSSSSRIFPFQPRLARARALRPCLASRDPDNGGEDDSFGFYPWDPRPSSSDAAGIQWSPEDRITLFTSDGLVQIGGSLVPRRIPFSDKQGKSRVSKRFQESDYMDPHQGLCLGALFDIAATNGLDTRRRLCIFGFCRSIEMLSDVVEDTVLEHGGEVVAAEKASKGGLHEKLSMTVAVPLLWGVPPASDTLHVAVRSGGGIIEKITFQWDFL